MKLRNLIVLALVGAVMPAAGALGDIVTYIVDPARSSLKLSGTFAGNPVLPQPGLPDSLTTSYFGTISADRDFVSNKLQITNGTVTAQTNGTFSPVGIGFGGGSTYYAPSDYGFQTGAGFTNPPTTGSTSAILDFSFSSLASPLISSPNNFDASLLSAAIASGEFDCVSSSPDVGGWFFPITGSLTFAPSTASLTNDSGVETLDIPIHTEFTYFAQGQPLTVQLSGSIIATAQVPEPTSVVFLGIAAMSLLFRCRK